MQSGFNSADIDDIVVMWRDNETAHTLLNYYFSSFFFSSQFDKDLMNHIGRQNQIKFA